MSANREKAERYVADPKFDDTRPRWAEVREAHLAGQESRQEEVDALREAVRDFLCECALAEDFHRSYDVWQITKGSMDELRRALKERP